VDINAVKLRVPKALENSVDTSIFPAAL